MKTKRITLKKLLNYVETEIKKCMEKNTLGERYVVLREIKNKIKGKLNEKNKSTQ